MVHLFGWDIHHMRWTGTTNHPEGKCADEENSGMWAIQKKKLRLWKLHAPH